MLGGFLGFLWWRKVFVERKADGVSFCSPNKCDCRKVLILGLGARCKYLRVEPAGPFSIFSPHKVLIYLPAVPLELYLCVNN